MNVPLWENIVVYILNRAVWGNIDNELKTSPWFQECVWFRTNLVKVHSAVQCIRYKGQVCILNNYLGTLLTWRRLEAVESSSCRAARAPEQHQESTAGSMISVPVRLLPVHANTQLSRLRVLVTRRWVFTCPEVPQRAGTSDNSSKEQTSKLLTVNII